MGFFYGLFGSEGSGGESKAGDDATGGLGGPSMGAGSDPTTGSIAGKGARGGVVRRGVAASIGRILGQSSGRFHSGDLSDEEIRFNSQLPPCLASLDCEIASL